MLSQQDLDVRLQLGGQKFSELSKRFSNDLKYGKKCTLKHREDLLLLNVYLEILECYCVVGETILSTGTIIFEGTDGSSIRLLIDNAYISSTYILVGDQEVDYPGVVDSINNFQTSYIASWDGSSNTINLTGPCDQSGGLGADATGAEGGGSIDVVVDGMIEGACFCSEDENCITEEELKEIVEKISLLTDICFMPEGFTYLEE